MLKTILILYLHSLYFTCPVKQKWALLGSNPPRDNRTHVDREGYDLFYWIISFIFSIKIYVVMP